MVFKSRLDRIEPAPILPGELKKHAIIDTIRELDLDPRLITLVGSAALHLYNIPLSSEQDLDHPDIFHERPRDVDIATPAMYWDELRRNGTTPGGIPVEYNASISHRSRVVSNSILNAHLSSAGLLPVDIITRFNGFDENDARQHDKKFLSKHDKFDHIIPGTNIRIASLGRIAAELSRRGNDDKAEYDHASLLRHAYSASQSDRNNPAS